MSTKYLLPCSCGHRVPVKARQAGQEIRCRCGAVLEVPTMQGLARLEQAEPDEAVARPPSRWGARQRLVLVGLVVFLVGVALGGYFHWTRPKVPDIDDFTVSQTWALWQDLRQGPDRLLPYEEARYEKTQAHRRWMALAGVLAAAGVLTMAGSVLVPRH